MARLSVILFVLYGEGLLDVFAQGIFEGPTQFIPVEVDRMYVKGINFLRDHQAKDGTFTSPGRSDSYGKQPGVVGLAVVAMLAHGDDPNRGPYALAIRRGLDFIVKSQNKSTGYIGSSMYNHGFATLALAEAYGQVHDQRLGAALKKATELILNAQKRSQRGGWRYSPESSDADTTVSGAQFVALMAARNAGLGVPQESLDKALRYFISCQSPDGGIGYTSAGSSNGPRTAIAGLCFALAKKKESQRFKAAMDYLVQQGSGGGYDHYYHYFLYYAAQTYFHASPKLWAEWNADNIKRLQSTQQEDGRWDSNFGGSFATAASLLSLALNYRYLPIYER
ncbi:MAG: terpene cyclase/mutase family protein [Verrucomicrobiota bacterium]|jgi:hypothetical protein|nr:terpene cyclase/mutase family protein [Verrucomicrobiota bacterium]